MTRERERSCRARETVELQDSIGRRTALEPCASSLMSCAFATSRTITQRGLAAVALTATNMTRAMADMMASSSMRGFPCTHTYFCSCTSRVLLSQNSKFECSFTDDSSFLWNAGSTMSSSCTRRELGCQRKRL
jgi:hypothetical protein